MKYEKVEKEIKVMDEQLISNFHYHPEIVSCQVNEQELTGQLSDGRKMSIPLDWFIKLGFKNIRPEQLTKYKIWEGGHIVFFPNINEPLHVRTFTDRFEARCCS